MPFDTNFIALIGIFVIILLRTWRHAVKEGRKMELPRELVLKCEKCGGSDFVEVSIDCVIHTPVHRIILDKFYVVPQYQVEKHMINREIVDNMPHGFKCDSCLWWVPNVSSDDDLIHYLKQKAGIVQ